MMSFRPVGVFYFPSICLLVSFYTIVVVLWCSYYFFFFSSRRRHTRLVSDWSSDVCSSDLHAAPVVQLDEHRVVLIELYYRGRMVAEVAEEFGVPVGTIKSRSYYAKLALR